MLKKFYEQGKDLHVANYMAYGKTADHKLYADAEYKEGVRASEMEDAFKKGRLVIIEGENCLVPVAYTADGAVTIDPATVKAVAWGASAAEEQANTLGQIVLG